MTATSDCGHRPRVGLFGMFGSGNLGNNASMEAALRYLNEARPDAIVDVKCGGPRDIRARYHVAATPFLYYKGSATGLPGAVLKALVKVADSVRLVDWVRRHDTVIIPGMGVFEGCLQTPPWGEPLRLFLVSLSGALFGTKVGYISVGADVVHPSRRITRWLFTRAASLATYCSVRDPRSREVFREWGVDVASMPVYPDLAFALPVPPPQAGDPKLVCVGVMDYRGNDHDRGREDDVRSAYVDEMTQFVYWLLTTGRDVRLLVGDVNGSDGSVVREIVAAIGQRMPALADGRLAAQPAISLDDILTAMSPAGTVVAIRFHNVVAALMLGKPVLAISYGHKQDSLMASFGVAEFCTSARTLDHEKLALQFTELTERAPGIRQDLLARKAESEGLLAEQFGTAARALLPHGR
jgi:polysaccharide pyruvyl transferase WcaK-like protein